ncbi:aminotransferase class V-fold PLP-dependent enzyme [Methyloraptor flagellatus]|uniref:Aminotransferase class V-fold PLP-dependent enzyme n=1 Tax=Methyloraptor flagellatus TaxID=3162530 RepID=A0AAU7XCF8_9HYPH
MNAFTLKPVDTVDTRAHAGADFRATFRAETPGTARVLHVNAAGAGLPPGCVTRAMTAFLEREAEVGPHWAADEVRTDLAAIRRSCADLMACRLDQVAFGESAGRLWAMAMLAMPVRRGARILIARSDWAGNLINLFKRARVDGVSVEIMPVDAAGRVDVAALGAAIDERTAALCMPLVGSGSGQRQPVEAVARLPRPEGSLFFVDAAQSLGREPVDMETLGADVLVAPARKWLRGPRGQALMALSDHALARLGDPPLLDQAGSAWTRPGGYTTRSDAARFEAFEFAVAGRLGLGAAVTHLGRFGVGSVCEAIRRILRRLADGLDTIDGLRAFERAEDDPAFLTFAVDGLSAETVGLGLAAAGICAATVGRDYARLELEARGVRAVTRLAPHAYTSDEEIDRLVDVLADIVAKARRRPGRRAG